MKICIAGWYFRPKFMETIRDSGYDAVVIKHREGDTKGIPSILYDNVGLEFGAYRKYAEHHWDGASDVLFLHDDTEITDPAALRHIESLADMGVDQAYIFHDGNEESVNGSIHGRGIWMRGSTLKMIADDFPADLQNTGVTSGLIAQKGILLFDAAVENLTPNTCVSAIVPGIRFAHRGTLIEKLFVFRRTNKRKPVAHA